MINSVVIMLRIDVPLNYKVLSHHLGMPDGTHMDIFSSQQYSDLIENIDSSLVQGPNFEYIF